VDGVGDHARLLAAALAEAGHDSRLVTIDWRSHGWWELLKKVRSVHSMRPDLVVLHYSHLGWSRRGLPFGLLLVVALSRAVGPVLLWVHDPGGVRGFRLRQVLGGIAKNWGLRSAVRIAGQAIVTVDPAVLPWLDGASCSVQFCPSPTNMASVPRQPPTDFFTVTCFGIALTTDAPTMRILEPTCVGLARVIGPFRLQILGANEPLSSELRDRLSAAGVIVDLPGAMSADDLGHALARSHVYWHAKGRLTTRSGTLSAALACGLPVVGMLGDETATPLDRGRVVVIGDLDVEGLISAIADLSSDPDRQQVLSAKSAFTSDEFYSWSRSRDAVLAVLESNDRRSRAATRR